MLHLNKKCVRQIKLFLCVYFLFVAQPVFASAAEFTEVKLDDTLEKAYVRTLILNPEPLRDTCLFHGSRVNCSEFFYFYTPAWSEIENESILEVHSQRFYVVMNPNTKFEWIFNCSSLAAGFRADVTLIAKIEEGRLKLRPEPLKDIILEFASYDGNYSECIFFEFPILNPTIVGKEKIRRYPFDSYNLKFGLFTPNLTLSFTEISLPNDFKIDRFDTDPMSKTESVSKNVILFVHKNLDKKTNMTYFEVEFSRYNGIEKVYPAILLLMIPVILTLYLLFSRNLAAQSSREKAVIGFYLVLLPLFSIYTNYFSSKPNAITFVEISLISSISLVFLSFLKDFTSFSFGSKKRYLIIIFCWLPLIGWYLFA